MKNSFQKLVSIYGENRIKKSEKLSKYTSFRIGGIADLFFQAKNVQELVSIISDSRILGIPVFILGGGTNLLISDEGFRGLVVKNETGRINIIGVRGRKEIGGKSKDIMLNTVYIEVESGVGVNRLVRFTLDQGLSGLESFLGQPGTVGGAIKINAHNMNKGKFFGERVREAKLLDESSNIKKVAMEYFRFGYDYSILQKTNETLLSAVLELKTGNKEELWKAATETLSYRQKYQPQGVYSSGCIFRNITKSEAIRISTPDYICSAGYLLESVGLKGFKHGPVNFSDQHANFIIHRGGATASDVLKLIEIAKTRVKEVYNIDLKEEIFFVK